MFGDRLKQLEALGRLRELSLLTTKISDAGFKSLRQALPNCEISLSTLSPSDIAE